MPRHNVEVTVLDEQEINSVRIAINGQNKYVAVPENGATLLEVMSAIMEKIDPNAEVVVTDPAGMRTLNNVVYTIRDGVSLGETDKPEDLVLPDDQIIADRKHHNG